jgi:DNA-binding transcriptional LysR family regulator
VQADLTLQYYRSGRSRWHDPRQERVTCPEGLVDPPLTPLIDAFHARFPGLRVDLIVTERFLDLSKG